MAVVYLTDEDYLAIEANDYARVPDVIRGGHNYGRLCLTSTLPAAFMDQLLSFVPTYLENNNGVIAGPDTEIVRFFKDTIQGYMNYKENLKKHLHVSF